MDRYAPSCSSVAGALAAGDSAPVEAFLERWLPRLRSFARGRMGAALRAREAASDIVQSACREVLPALAERAGLTEAELRVWFFRAVGRKAAERARYHGAERRSPAREMGAGDPESDLAVLSDVYSFVETPSRHAMRAEEIERTEEALGELAPNDREVLELRYLVGLDVVETARVVGVTGDAVKQRTRRALARLAKRLAAGA